MIRITDQYLWNVVFILFFLSLMTMGIIILDTEAYIAYVDLTFFDVAIISLASFRLIRLFMYDSITKFFREQFYDAKMTKVGKVTLHKPLKGPRRTITDLLGCPWCFSLWTTSVVVFFYLLSPAAYFLILILAISAVATSLQNILAVIQARVE